jgi:hypothetical protein
MKSTFLIGVGGQFDNGKDTLADHLAKTCQFTDPRPQETRTDTGSDVEWSRNAFANEVKRVFEDTFGVTRAWVEHWKRIDSPPPGFLKTVRQMLIDIGDGFRSFRADVWIEKALSRPADQIISDARYLNELKAIKDRGGITIAIYRPDRENQNPNKSEQELRAYIQKFIDKGIRGVTGDDLVDVFVVNDNGVEGLYQFCADVVTPYITKTLGGKAASQPLAA